MAWTTARLVTATRVGGELWTDIEYGRDDSPETVTFKTVQTNAFDLSAQARATLTRLNGVTVTVTPGPIDVSPPTPSPDPDQPVLDQFTRAWRRFVHGQGAIDLGVLLPTDADIAALKASITDALAAATPALKRRMLDVASRAI